MEFTLVHRGLLKASGDARDKHMIRRALHKQLSELWKHPPLSHRAEALLADPPIPAKVSLIQPVGDFTFAPLVSSRISLFAEIAITLLRPHLPGSLIAQGGDIDNRVKTLLDALRMPTNVSEIPTGDVPLQDETPFFCLLEDDGLVSSLSVSTDRLLEPGIHGSEALVIMRVRTKSYAMTYANIDLW